ncbi:hypothetical protein FQR65_LT07505 [Abscondita terminalis]|nr:hypothetical protein FQR65_LT07505 [Abscondita terminalis]
MFETLVSVVSSAVIPKVDLRPSSAIFGRVCELVVTRLSPELESRSPSKMFVKGSEVKPSSFIADSGVRQDSGHCSQLPPGSFVNDSEVRQHCVKAITPELNARSLSTYLI